MRFLEVLAMFALLLSGGAITLAILWGLNLVKKRSYDQGFKAGIENERNKPFGSGGFR